MIRAWKRERERGKGKEKRASEQTNERNKLDGKFSIGLLT